MNREQLAVMLVDSKSTAAKDLQSALLQKLDGLQN